MPDSQNRLRNFLHELKRRKIIQVIVVYATTAFILIQLAKLFEDALPLPSWLDTLVVILLVIGFPIAIIFSWIFDVYSKGITKTEAEPDKAPSAESSKPVPEKSIIVLPFENTISDNHQQNFTNGIFNVLPCFAFRKEFFSYFSKEWYHFICFIAFLKSNI